MATAEPSRPIDSPYPGLRPFRRGEARFFFGRDEQGARLVERIRRPSGPRWLAVIGSSGSGKTSLIEAGLIASLKQSARTAGASGRWKFINVRPGVGLSTDLANDLVRCFPSLEDDSDRSTAAAYVADDLRRGPMGLIRVLDGVIAEERADLLLVVDPFEELISDRGQADSEEARAVVDLLLTSAREDASMRVHVVLALRAELLGACAFHSELARATADGAFLVPAIARELWSEVIEGPARRLGGVVEPALLVRLLADMGRHRDQLPLLQHLLRRLWILASLDVPPVADPAGSAVPVTMTLDHFRRAQGFESLSHGADEVLANLEKAERPVAEAMFRLLSTRQVLHLDRGRPVTLPELERTIMGTPPDLIRRVVLKFHEPGCALIAPQEGSRITDASPFVLGHDALIAGWPWLDREVNRDRNEHDVFLCHNSRDKDAVRELALALRSKFQVLPWFDEWDLRPGLRYQKTIWERMRTIRSIAVIVGRNGAGPWQDDEVDQALREAVKRGCPVIPVILADCEADPKLPEYFERVEGFTWVDFRTSTPDPWNRLRWGITGRRIDDPPAGEAPR